MVCTIFDQFILPVKLAHCTYQDGFLEWQVQMMLIQPCAILLMGKMKNYVWDAGTIWFVSSQTHISGFSQNVTSLFPKC